MTALIKSDALLFISCTNTEMLLFKQKLFKLIQSRKIKNKRVLERKQKFIIRKHNIENHSTKIDSFQYFAICFNNVSN